MSAGLEGILDIARFLSPMDIEMWVEPFAGGAGAGLTLLCDGCVDDLWLVEQNPAMAAFWRVVAADGGRLADLIANTRPTVALFDECRGIVAAAAPATGDGFEPSPADPRPAAADEDSLRLAWAAFVVNRCSRSGIVSGVAGPIGGRRQHGRWKVGDRFNADALAERVARLHATGGIRVLEGDAIDYIAQHDGSVGIEDEVFLFVDPPYIAEGNRLYGAGMARGDHARLARALARCTAPWVLTYDAHPAVPDLYPTHQIAEYSVRYTANTARPDVEYAVFSPILGDAFGTTTAPPDLLGRGDVTWLPAPVLDRLV